MTLEKLIKKLPKAELHVHIEGTLEPELLIKIANRNNISIKYDTEEKLLNAYNFNNLQEFLDIYYEGANVLVNRRDFFDLTWSYLEKLKTQNVRHVELFFDPQTHTSRGIHFSTIIGGINDALKEAKNTFGISGETILCFLRHLDEKDAFTTLESALEYKEFIIGVGLDSSELGFPPSNFTKVFKKARDEGFKVVAHAGEEGPPEYIWEAINKLKVERIDHGNRALEDNELINYLREKQIPLTICPISNLKLKVVSNLSKHPLKTMMDNNLLVTINSDDPSYFGGGVNDNYIQISSALDLTTDEIITLVKNSFQASTLGKSEVLKYASEIDHIHSSYNINMV